ncbi:MAG: RNA chaperone Hfq [Candidatus Xenobiia bacterium LiM19]
MQLNLQDAYLAQVKKENNGVIIYLVNGFQLKGIIKGFDNFTIFIENNEGKLQMIYKHSVTTINAMKPVNINFLGDAFKEALGTGEKEKAVKVASS